MIQIHPTIQFSEPSPYEDGTLIPKKVIWQGVHTCVETVCSRTGQTIIADLPVGHAVTNACKVNIETQELFCSSEVRSWLGVPLLESLSHPADDDVRFRIERRTEHRSVIILNCIDHLYGHALLKLFNVERHLRERPEIGVVVLIQDFLRWLVPEGVAEIWSVHIPLGKAMRYHRMLDTRISEECRRFTAVFLSNAYSHPAVSDISMFTRIQRHDDHAERYRITYIWRDDRPWTSNPYLILAAKRLGFMSLLLRDQNQKIVRMFERLRKALPEAQFTIAGIGKGTTFPSWIDDRRVTTMNDSVERSLCTVYAESRLVIGVHGSNMLLPSAHAGMTIDLMPTERWGNFAQDIVYQEHDPRIGSFRYRFFPIGTSVSILAHLIETQIREFEYFKRQMSH